MRTNCSSGRISHTSGLCRIPEIISWRNFRFIPVLLFWTVIASNALQGQEGISAQQVMSRLDSLQLELARSDSDSDSFRLHALLAEELIFIDAEACLRNIEAARAIENYYTGWVAPHLANSAGMCHDDLGNFDEAVKNYRLAIEGTHAIIEAGSDSHPLLQPVVPEGWNYRWDLVVYHNNLGYALFNTGNYSAAVQEYLKAELIAIESSCPDLSVVYGSMAELFFAVGDTEQAMKFVEKVRSTSADSSEYVMNAIIAGRIYLSQLRPDSARLFYDHLLNVARAAGSNYDMAVAYQGLSQTAFVAGEYELSLTHADSCLATASRLGSAYYLSAGLALKGKAMAQLGQTEAAAPMFLEAIAIAEDKQMYVELDDHYRDYATLLASSGDFEGAFFNSQRAQQLVDSISGSSRTLQLQQLALRQEIERQERLTDQLREELAREQNDVRRSNSFGIAMMLFALLSAVASLLVLRRQGLIAIDESPSVTYEPVDDKRDFLRRIGVTVGLLFVPPLIYASIWTHWMDTLIIAIAIAFCTFLYAFARLSRSLWLPLIVLFLGYPFIALVPLHTGPVPTLTLWIPALFLILAYTLNDVKLQVINGVLALGTYFAFNYFGRISGIDQPSDRGPLEVMLGIVALCTVLMALFYHRGELFEYRFGLDKTSRFLRLIADLNPNFIFAKDMKRQYLFANSAMIRSYGKPLGDFIGKVPEDVNEAYRESDHFINDDRKVLEEGATVYIPEEKVYDKDGNEVWLETIKKPIMNDKGHIVGLVGIATDITDKRQALSSQRESVSLLTSTVESTADAILVVDSEYRAVLYNEKFSDMMHSLGIENLRDGAVRLVEFAEHTTDPQGFLARVREIMDDMELKTLDTFELKDGRFFERYSQAYIIQGRNAGRVWSFRDVSESVSTTRALRASEQLYRRILEDNHFPIMRVIDDVVRSSNKAFTTLTGYSDSDFGKLRLFEFIHPEDLPTFLECARDVMKSPDTVRSITCRVKRVDGSTRYILASLKGYFDVDGKALELIVTAADITQMKQFETALKESEQRYRSLLEASPDGIIMTDTKGFVTFASAQMLNMVGTNDEDRMVKRHMLEFAHPSERDRAKSDLKRAMNSLEPTFGRYMVQLDNGGIMHVELGARRVDNSLGQPIGMIIVTRDITRHVAAEQDLRESEKKYRTLFESTFDGFVLMDTDLGLVDANQSALELLACKDLEHLRQSRLNDLIDEEQFIDLLIPIRTGKSDRSKIVRVTGQNLRREPIYVEISFASMVVEGEGLIACAIRDVAEKVVLEVKENELRQQEIEVEALNRELTASALYASQKNKLLSDIQDDIANVTEISDDPVKSILQKVKRKIITNLNDHDELLAFRLQFEKVHPNFFNKLLAACPKLTDHELKYCAYIRLNMSTQDICNLLYVEKKSVEMSKYRIKKKLKLHRQQRLSEFLHTL